MAGELIRDYGSWVDLEANGASISSAAFGEANDATFGMVGSGGGRLHLEFELEFANSTNTTGVPFLTLLARHLNVLGSSNHALSPSSTAPGRPVANLQTAIATTSTQRFRFDVLFAPTDASYWLANNTGQAVAAGWKLRARAWSPKAAT